MNKNYWLFGLVLILSISFVSALTITSPSYNQSVNSTFVISWNNISNNTISDTLINNQIVDRRFINSSGYLYTPISNNSFISNASYEQGDTSGNFGSWSGFVKVRDLNDSSFESITSSMAGGVTYYNTMNIVFINKTMNLIRIKASLTLNVGAGTDLGNVYLESYNGSSWIRQATLISIGDGGGTTNIDSVYNISSYGYISGLRLYAESQHGTVQTTTFSVYEFDEAFNASNSLFTYSILNNNLNIGTNNLTIKNYNSSFSLLSNASSIFNLLSNSVLNISVFNLSASPISSFNISLTDLSSGSISYYSTSSNSILANVINGRSYSIIYDNVLYALAYQNVSITSSSQFTNTTLLPNNALNITLIDESSALTLTSVSTITILSNSYSINGSGIASNLVASSYSIRISNPFYATKNIYVSIPDRSFQNLNIYMSNGTAVLFNFKTATTTVLPNVLFKVYTYVNGSLVLSESSVSDITGKSQVAIKGNTQYFFTTYLSGYVNQSFTLNPVLFSSYDVPLYPIGSGSNVVPSAYVSFSPSAFNRFDSVNFNIEFFSPYNSLTYYRYNVSYPSGYVNGSGSSSSGSSFTNPFSFSSGGFVTIFYEWNLSNGVYANHTETFRIINSLSNRTIFTSQANNQGMLIGDLVLRDTMIMIVMFGMGWLAFGFFGSLALGGLSIGIILGNGAYTQIQSMIFVASLIIIVLLIIFRGRQ